MTMLRLLSSLLTLSFLLLAVGLSPAILHFHDITAAQTVRPFMEPGTPISAADFDSGSAVTPPLLDADAASPLRHQSKGISP